jgi:hypothetical protein
MTKTLLSLSIAALLGSLAMNASAASVPRLDSPLIRTEGTAPAVGSSATIAREASEGPRGGDHERPGDRQRRGGRGRG